MSINTCIQAHPDLFFIVQLLKLANTFSTILAYHDMKLGRIIIVVAATLSIACSSGKKAFERGDYYGAVMKAVNRLRHNPDHSKSAEALQSAYPLAVEFFEGQAKNEIDSNSPFK